MVISEQDRQLLLRDAGESCSLAGQSTRADGSPLYCIFRKGFEPQDFQGKVVNAEQIEARLSSGDVAAAKRGASFSVLGSNYLVENIEPDARGWTFLYLVKAS